MSFPQIPDRNSIVTPPVHKTMLTCCGFTCAQGIPAPWICPGCGKLHDEHVPKPPAGGA